MYWKCLQQHFSCNDGLRRLNAQTSTFRVYEDYTVTTVTTITQTIATPNKHESREGGQQRHSHLPRVVETILAAGNSVDVQQHPKTVPGIKTEKKRGKTNNFTHNGPAHGFSAIMYHVASKQADTNGMTGPLSAYSR